MYIYLCVIECIYMFSCAQYVQVIHVTCPLPCWITNYQGQMNMYFTRVHLNGHQLSSLHLFVWKGETRGGMWSRAGHSLASHPLSRSNILQRGQRPSKWKRFWCLLLIFLCWTKRKKNNNIHTMYSLFLLAFFVHVFCLFYSIDTPAATVRRNIRTGEPSWFTCRTPRDTDHSVYAQCVNMNSSPHCP